jgi:spermidine synthase
MFKELDYRETPLGALSLRRRYDPKLRDTVLEIKLGEEFLMSSAFTASEAALARLALADLPAPAVDVVIGGLGLGYTAAAALDDATVASLIVVDALAAVIDWHREGVLPLGPRIAGDPRCRLVEGDFFALAASPDGFDPDRPGWTFDAILVDIDHSPEALLAPQNASFYSDEGLAGVARHLKPGGVFGLWSNEAPDDAFTARLARVFTTARAEPVTFHNPLQDRPFTQTVYLAQMN